MQSSSPQLSPPAQSAKLGSRPISRYSQSTFGSFPLSHANRGMSESKWLPLAGLIRVGTVEQEIGVGVGVGCLATKGRYAHGVRVPFAARVLNVKPPDPTMRIQAVTKAATATTATIRLLACLIAHLLANLQAISANAPIPKHPPQPQRRAGSHYFNPYLLVLLLLCQHPRLSGAGRRFSVTHTYCIATLCRSQDFVASAGSMRLDS